MQETCADVSPSSVVLPHADVTESGKQEQHSALSVTQGIAGVDEATHAEGDAPPLAKGATQPTRAEDQRRGQSTQYRSFAIHSAFPSASPKQQQDSVLSPTHGDTGIHESQLISEARSHLQQHGAPPPMRVLGGDFNTTTSGINESTLAPDTGHSTRGECEAPPLAKEATASSGPGVGMPNELDILGNALATLPADWPLARPGLAPRDHRLQRVELRRAYAWYIQQQQQTHGLPVLPACTWCGQPTGMWCDLCTGAICSECCNASNVGIDICRSCATSRFTAM